MREILQCAVLPEDRAKLGSLLAEIGRDVNLTDEEFAIVDQVRDRNPVRPLDLE